MAPKVRPAKEDLRLSSVALLIGLQATLSRYASVWGSAEFTDMALPQKVYFQS
jgi:hypothetical protein